MIKDKKQTNKFEDDEIMFEPETDSDMLGGGKMASDSGKKVLKLKKELKKCKEQAKENLDGWQRTKAELVNYKKQEAERTTSARERGAEDVLVSILPALDSFESAMQSNAWQQVDEAWRSGMEFVHTQLINALAEHGVMAYGREGENFDSSLHEASEHAVVDSKDEHGKILRVVQKGYKNKTKVLRPARVIVGDYKENK